MKADTPITFAAAKYVNRGHALEDWQAIKDSQRFGDVEHMAVAVLSKGSDGMLQVEPHDPTAGHLPWVGAALLVVEASELLEQRRGRAGRRRGEPQRHRSRTAARQRGEVGRGRDRRG